MEDGDKARNGREEVGELHLEVGMGTSQWVYIESEDMAIVISARDD